MVASRAARQRKAAVEAGDLATVRIDLDATGGFRYTIACTTCRARAGRTDGPWSTYRTGTDNGFLAAMDRWTFHLHEQHPDATAPCLGYLPAAQQRLHERRLREESADRP